MIRDNTIICCFDKRPSLLEWLKKVEQDQNKAVKQVAIENGNLVVTFLSGETEIVGPVGGENPYADIILINSVTNTTEIGNNVEIAGETKINAGLEVVNEFNCDNIVAKGAIQTDIDVIIAGVSIDDKISSAINSAITSTLEANY